MLFDRQPFLDVIAANPEDDLPRLVYADRLDEVGDQVDRDHAFLIRWMCRQNRDGVILYRPGSTNAVRPGPYLQFRNCGRLMKRLHVACGNPLSTQWKRGFLQQVRVSDGAVVYHDKVRRFSAGMHRMDILLQSTFDFNRMIGDTLTQRAIDQVEMISNHWLSFRLPVTNELIRDSGLDRR